METVTIHDKKFRRSISAIEIKNTVERLATALNDDLQAKEVVFVVILNGAFMFASDLMKKIRFNTRISFIKLASYKGTESTGQIKEIIGLNEVVKGKTVVIIEDIIDSGNTLDAVVSNMLKEGAAEVKIATLLFKPDNYRYEYPIDYAGFTIPNDFVVGYGLDYNGLGRNLEDIYTVIES
jgi:hypoxanthine phosphoribosyltransferase